MVDVMSCRAPSRTSGSRTSMLSVTQSGMLEMFKQRYLHKFNRHFNYVRLEFDEKFPPIFSIELGTDIFKRMKSTEVDEIIDQFHMSGFERLNIRFLSISGNITIKFYGDSEEGRESRLFVLININY